MGQSSQPAVCEAVQLPGDLPAVCEAVQFPGDLSAVCEAVQLPGDLSAVCEAVQLPEDLPAVCEAVQRSAAVVESPHHHAGLAWLERPWQRGRAASVPGLPPRWPCG